MDKEEHLREGRSLSETPNWAVATVITVILILGFFFHGFLKKLGKWLDKTKRKALLAALEKIRDELMLFGLLSLLMGHWIHFVAKICVKKSAISSTFYPCASKEELLRTGEHVLSSTSNYLNNTFVRVEVATTRHHGYCPEGHESFASYESLEQLHRFVFVLGVTHVLYSFIAIALAMIKIYSWRIWENQAKAMAVQSIQDSSEASSNNRRIVRVTTFVFHQASHPWSQHKVLVWLLCFSRQCWSSIHRSDYMALRLGFITTHQLPLTYDFHNYMLRSMEEEFCDIVGISIPLWIYAIFCIILNFHGTNVYFWLSFLPAILILLIGTKLHRVVVKLAVEIMDNCPWTENHQFNLRDDLFWFGKPRLLLRLIQLISFQNALEMASFIWSLWEIKEPSCFMENRRFLVVRLAFGIISQFWCSFITFPLYVIITQMGSRFKRSVVSENVRIGLSKWQKRVKGKRKRDETSNKISTALLLDSKVEEGSDEFDDCVSSSKERRSAASEDDSVSSSKERRSAASEDALPAYDDKLEEPFCLGSQHDSYSYSRCYGDYRVDVENDDIS